MTKTSVRDCKTDCGSIVKVIAEDALVLKAAGSACEKTDNCDYFEDGSNCKRDYVRGSGKFAPQASSTSFVMM